MSMRKQPVTKKIIPLKIHNFTTIDTDVRQRGSQGAQSFRGWSSQRRRASTLQAPETQRSLTARSNNMRKLSARRCRKDDGKEFCDDIFKQKPKKAILWSVYDPHRSPKRSLVMPRPVNLQFPFTTVKATAQISLMQAPAPCTQSVSSSPKQFERLVSARTSPPRQFRRIRQQRSNRLVRLLRKAQQTSPKKQPEAPISAWEQNQPLKDSFVDYTEQKFYIIRR